MAPTPTLTSSYHKPGADGIGVSEKEAKPETFTTKTSKQPIPLKNYLTGEVHYDTLYQNAEKVFKLLPNNYSYTYYICMKSYISLYRRLYVSYKFHFQPMACSQTVCLGSHIEQNQYSVEEDLKRKAKKYLTQFYGDHNR